MYNNSYQTQKENNMDFKRKKQLQKCFLFGYFKAFSLVELMISLIIISLIAAAFVPVVTKKLSSDSIISGNIGKITTNCEEKFGENCKLCDKNRCINCEIANNDNQKFIHQDTCSIKSCSDEKYGYGANLPIPNTVTVVNYKNGYCYAQNQKCCWQGDYSEKCDNKSDYNDCKRTVCNWQAAKEICEKFNYEGKIWRLPDMELNVFNFGNFTTHLKENGLQMCGFTDSYYCPDEEGCYSNDYCSPSQFWSSEETGANTAKAYYPWYTDVYNDSTRLKKAAYSVRCATIF